MKHLHLFVYALAALSTVPVLAEPERAANSDSPEMRYSPLDHLEPEDAYDSSGYSQIVFSSLLGKNPGTLWMVAMPSDGQEFSVKLGRDLNKSGEVDSVHTGRWLLEYAKARTRIYRNRESEDDGARDDYQVTNEVDRHVIEVPSDFAVTMARAWKAVIKSTRYPHEPSQSFDGVTYHFSLIGLSGVITSPQSGNPKMLATLSDKLCSAAVSGIEKRNDLLGESLDIAKQIVGEVVPRTNQ